MDSGFRDTSANGVGGNNFWVNIDKEPPETVDSDDDIAIPPDSDESGAETAPNSNPTGISSFM